MVWFTRDMKSDLPRRVRFLNCIGCHTNKPIFDDGVWVNQGGISRYLPIKYFRRKYGFIPKKGKMLWRSFDPNNFFSEYDFICSIG